MSPKNHHLRVKGGQLDKHGTDYYKILVDIIEVKYTGWPHKKPNFIQM